MCATDRPLGYGGISAPTLVAIRTLARLPAFFSQLPMAFSDSPPRWPGPQVEYMSAVSMKLKPAAKKASIRRCEVASSAVQPNTLPPSASGANSRPDWPSLRLSMSNSQGYLPGDNDASRGRTPEARGGQRAESAIRWAGDDEGAGTERCDHRRAGWWWAAAASEPACSMR